ARAAFCMNFFGVAGFEVNDPGSLGEVSKDPVILEKTRLALKNILEKKNESASAATFVYVLCSSDEEYREILETYSDLLMTSGLPVVIAGNPENSGELESLGASDFVHARSNLYETLRKYQSVAFAKELS